MKVAICLASYGRPHELMRQVYAMMDQSYKDLHVFAAVKGYTEAFFKEVIVPPLQHFVDEGRLTLRLFPNSNQLTNFVDTVRDINIDDYELFLKIDDDDWYHREYVKTVVELLDEQPIGISSGMAGDNPFLQRIGDTYAVGKFRYAQLSGCSLCLSQQCMRRIILVEGDRDLLEKDIKRWKGNNASLDIGWMEDRYFTYLANANGCIQYKEAFEKKGIIPYHVGWIDNWHSVTRSSLQATEFGRATKGCVNKRQYWIQTDLGVFRLFNGEAIKEGNDKRTGKVLSEEPDTVVIQFEGIKKNTIFYKQEDGSYKASQ